MNLLKLTIGEDGPTAAGQLVIPPEHREMKGPWSQLVWGCPKDVDAIHIQSTIPASRGRYRLDFGKGPAGSEEIIVRDWETDGGDRQFTVSMKRGERFSVRCLSCEGDRGEEGLIVTATWPE